MWKYGVLRSTIRSQLRFEQVQHCASASNGVLAVWGGSHMVRRSADDAYMSMGV